MLKLIGWTIKVSLFAVLVLVLGNWVHWGGKTVNDQLKTQLAHPERLPGLSRIREWTGGLEEAGENEAPRGRQARPARASHRHHPAVTAAPESQKRSEATVPSPAAPAQEKVSPTERQKLRALIQELNTSSSPTARN